MNDVMNEQCEHNQRYLEAKSKQLRALEHRIMGQFLRIIRQGLPTAEGWYMRATLLGYLKLC